MCKSITVHECNTQKGQSKICHYFGLSLTSQVQIVHRLGVCCHVVVVLIHRGANGDDSQVDLCSNTYLWSWALGHDPNKRGTGFKQLKWGCPWHSLRAQWPGESSEWNRCSSTSGGIFEVAWAFGLDASLGRSTRHVPLGGDPRDALDVLVKTSLAGLVLPQRSPPRGAGGSGLGEGSLGVFASTAAWPYISQKKKKKKMERWILNVKPTFICSVNSSSNLYKTSQLLNSHKYIMCCIMPTFHSSFWTEKNKGCMSEAALLTSGPSSEDSGDWTAVRSGPVSTQLSLLFGVFMNISRPGCSVTSLRKMLDEAQEGNKKIEVFYI